MTLNGGAEANSPVIQQDHLETKAAILLMSLCLVWGLGQVASKVAVSGYSPTFIVGVRSFLSLLIVLTWCRIRHIRLFERDKSLRPGLLAGFFFGAEFIVLYYALDYTSAARSIIFLFTSPFFVAIGAHFLIPAERLDRLKFFGLVCAFAGMVIAFSDRLSLIGPQAWLGDLLAVIAAIFWAATSLTIKASRLQQVSAEKTLAYQLAVSAAMFLPFAPFVGPVLREPDWISTSGLAYQILFVAASTYLVWFWMIRRYPVSILSSFLFVVPVSGLAFAALLLNEPISLRLLISLTLIAAGIALVNRQ